MLKEIYIKNYALIDRLTIHFNNHLTVLSGETGAGKSIIVGALGLILGEKAKTSSIRTGQESCSVEGRWEVLKHHPVLRLMAEKGIEHEEGEDIVIRRVITSSGVSKSYIDGFQVNIKDLQDVTRLLIDVHGQHEHQSLLNVRNHCFLLDQYGKLQGELQKYQKSYQRVQALQGEIEKRTMDEREKERRIELLRYSLNEIENAELREGEDAELASEYKVLKNYEELASSVMQAYNHIKASDSAVLPSLESSLAGLSKISDISKEVKGILTELENAKFVIEDCALSLKSYIDGIEYEPGKIDAILSRIELIKSLKKKYGETPEQIRQYAERCANELESLEMNEDVIKDLKNELKEELERAQQYAIELSARRRVSAHMLEQSVMKELSYLHMGKSSFKVNISYREQSNGPVTIDGKRYALTLFGLDQIEFLICTNIGEPLMPLKNVASGGELSRVMLAIKTVLGEADPILTFVFDEVDAGIGGKVAWAVGNRLRDLSRFKQILCITHQPQIASKGDLNIRVEKFSKDQRTITEVKLLNSQEKVEEIARMISGKRISEAALRQAHEMITER